MKLSKLCSTGSPVVKDHVVEEGQCLTSIADSYGFFWDTLWNHADNSALKKQRGNPNMLMPGDVVHIPDKRKKMESCALNQKHQFKLKGIPALFRIQLFRGDEPRANQDYEMVLDGKLRSGKTDGDGVLEEPIPASAQSVTLTIGPDLSVYTFNFGQLPPVSELTGVQARLRNLGFDCDVTGQLDQQTKDALSKFQEQFSLTVNGEVDDSTRGKLESVHDTAGALS